MTYVFDISDTDGSEEYLPVLVKGLFGNSEEEKEIYEKLLEVISRKHRVREVTGTASKGSFHLDRRIYKYIASEYFVIHTIH